MYHIAFLKLIHAPFSSNPQLGRKIIRLCSFPCFLTLLLIVSFFLRHTRTHTEDYSPGAGGKIVLGCDEVLAVDSCAGGPVLAGAIHLLPLGQAEIEMSQEINIRVIRSQAVVSLDVDSKLKKSKFNNKCFSF